MHLTLNSTVKTTKITIWCRFRKKCKNFKKNRSRSNHYTHPHDVLQQPPFTAPARQSSSLAASCSFMLLRRLAKSEGYFCDMSLTNCAIRVSHSETNRYSFVCFILAMDHILTAYTWDISLIHLTIIYATLKYVYYIKFDVDINYNRVLTRLINLSL